MHHYVYDRAVCTGLGDRVGAIMTLATLARLNYVDVVFPWCEDPELVLPKHHRQILRKYIPLWHGYRYNLTEFQNRFLPKDFPITIVAPELTPEQKESSHKVKWTGLEVPAEAWLDHVYTTAWTSVQLPDRPVLDGEKYKQSYRWLARSLILHAIPNNFEVIEKHSMYIAVHLRGPDDNTYHPFPGFHDEPRHYCTSHVLKRVTKRIPGVSLVVLTNNASWARGIVPSGVDITVSSDYDDFALLLGASAIVQHANHGWSAFSSNPSMMTGAPLITTYRRHLEHHKLGWFEKYGGIPDEYYGCEQTKTFIQVAKRSLFR